MDLQIIKIASDNKNQKILKKYTHEIKNKNSICGDEITIKLLINNKIIKAPDGFTNYKNSFRQ